MTAKNRGQKIRNVFAHSLPAGIILQLENDCKLLITNEKSGGYT